MGATIVLGFLLLVFVLMGTQIFDSFMGFPFAARIFLVCLLLLPFGICLGVYFPCGLQLISKNYESTIAWAWGINAGFSVLGSMLAIFIAQFYGFNAVLLLALTTYLIGVLAFFRLAKI